MRIFLPSILILLITLSACEPADPQSTPDAEAEVLTEVTVAFHLGAIEEDAGLRERDVRGEDRTLYLSPQPILTEDHVRAAEVAQNEFGSGLRLLLTDEGRQRLLEATTRNVGQMMAIAVNGEVISAPEIREAMDTEQVLVTGTLTAEEVEWIAASLNATR